MVKFLCSLIVFVIILFASYSGMATSVDKISHIKHKKITASISQLLRDNYVFPEVANKVAKQLLLNLNNNEYQGYDELWLFADRLTDDIQE